MKGPTQTCSTVRSKNNVESMIFVHRKDRMFVLQINHSTESVKTGKKPHKGQITMRVRVMVSRQITRIVVLPTLYGMSRIFLWTILYLK